VALTLRAGSGRIRSSRRKTMLFALGALLCLAQWASLIAQDSPPPQLTAGLKAEIDSLIESVHEAESEIEVTLQQSKLIRTRFEIKRAAVADPAIVEFVPYGTTEVELIGKDVGATTVTLWLDNNGEEHILSFLARVRLQKSDERRMEYEQLQDQINEMFPESRIALFPIANKLIVKGQARDSEDATRIMQILRQNASSALANFSSQGAAGSNQAVDPVFGRSTQATTQVVNLLKVPGEQQVMLKVKIAELHRSAARDLGVDFNLDIGDFLFGSAVGGAPGNVLFNGTFNEDSFNLFLKFLEGHRAARVLSQPNLVTLNGQTATFIAGGEFAVPTVVGVGGAQAATTTFRGFGTQLTFTPTIVDKDRIRLNVSPQFSTVNQDNAVNGIPGVDTRAVTTTVDLREGQVLAIAGLVLDQQSGSRSRIPWLSDLPAVGVLFNNKGHSSDETELIMLVSPEIVHAMEPDEVPSLLPGMDVSEPDDFDFYIRSQIEGRPNGLHRSTVWPKYRDMLVNPKFYLPAYQQSQGYYVDGMHGLSQ